MSKPVKTITSTPVKTITSMYTPGQPKKLHHESLPTLAELLKGQHLRALSDTIKDAPFEMLSKIEGDLKARFILQHFVQYHRDFKTANDFLIYSFACGKYLVENVAADKVAETYPVNLRSREASRERKAWLEAIRLLSKRFEVLGLSAEQCKLFVDEVSKHALPIVNKIDRFSEDAFAETCRTLFKQAAANKPAVLAEKILQLEKTIPKAGS